MAHNTAQTELADVIFFVSNWIPDNIDEIGYDLKLAQWLQPRGTLLIEYRVGFP